jgi:Ca2+-binding RTX toxin-like protein
LAEIESFGFHMTTVDINLSQKTIDQLHQIDTGSSTNLSEFFGDIVDINSYISDNFNSASSWSSKGSTLTLKFGSIATLTYAGSAYNGAAVASSRVLSAPSYFKESITGTLYYNYYVSGGYLSYSSTGTANINTYKFESFQSNSNYGKSSYFLNGNLSINSANGNITGTLSNLNVSTSKVGQIEILGNFSVSSNVNNSSNSSVTGTLSQYNETYLDKSYIKVNGNLSLQRGTILDESVLANENYFSGDDEIKIALPSIIYSDYVMNSGNGNDSIIAAGGGGRLFINAGSGNDQITINDASPIVNGGDGTDAIKSSIISVDLNNCTNVENITLLGTKALNATGNSETNVLTGNSAANVLDGGGAGAGLGDTLIGDAGNDTFIVRSSYDNISDSAGIDLVKSYVTWELASGFENLTLLGTDNTQGTGNSTNNFITGNDSGNLLMGMDGVDTLYGLGGDDTLDGGGGADKLIGGVGDDTYIIDDIKDTITEKVNEGTDTIETALTSISLAKLAAVENLHYTGFSSATLVGNALSNTLTGSTGNDKLDGGTGSDSLVGGNGNDLYIVDNVSDSITENDAEGTDYVQSSVTFTLSSYVENLTLTGKTAINGTGNDQDNIIAGNSAANTLNGGLGNDTLDGGTGNDTLTGGDGADIFKFSTALGKTNIDTVTDFTHGTDQLQLDDAIFKKFIGSSGQVGAGNFVSGGNGVKAVDTNDYLIFNTTTGALFYDADGSGKGAAIQFATITLVGVQELSASDFLVI